MTDGLRINGPPQGGCSRKRPINCAPGELSFYVLPSALKRVAFARRPGKSWLYPIPPISERGDQTDRHCGWVSDARVRELPTHLEAMDIAVGRPFISETLQAQCLSSPRIRLIPIGHTVTARPSSTTSLDYAEALAAASLVQSAAFPVFSTALLPGRR
jgi:hypothetical protein